MNSLFRTSSAVLVRAFPLILSGLVPQLTSLVVLTISHAAGTPSVTALLGLTSSLTGLAFVATVGVSICTVRDLVRARKQSAAAASGDPEAARVALSKALQSNWRIANSFAVFSLLLSAVFILIYSRSIPEEHSWIVWSYFLSQSLSLLVTPYFAVMNGAYQFVDRSRENLFSSAAVGLCSVGAAALCFQLSGSPSTALTAFGLSQSFISGAVLLIRLTRLSRKFGVVPWDLRFDFSAGRILERLAGAIDGAVFMTVFLLVQMIATSISVQTGAEIALAVGVARMVVVPLKQVGLTYGRMRISGLVPADDGKAASLGVLAVSTWTIVVPICLVIVAVGLLGRPVAGSWALSLLIVAQFLVEPFAGVLYGALKMTAGPKAGLAGLFVSYGLVASAGLVFLQQTAGDAVQFWALLLAVRVLFALLTTRVWVRFRPAVEPVAVR